MSADGASYRDAGVDYDALDSAKRLAMLGALSTSPLLAARGGRAVDASRGEPAFVFELGDRTFALVLEGLGTKSMIARAVLETQGLNRFADVAFDAVAAILNDLACVGALPLVLNAYFATGSSGWYEQRERAEALLDPSLMYVGLVAELLRSRTRVRYLSHVTGHGLLKLMRPAAAFTYRISALPEVPTVLAFLAEQAALGAREAYSTFNMGVGYAVYCAEGESASVLAAAERVGLSALAGGRVERGPRQVILEPLGVRYDSSELELSASGG